MASPTPPDAFCSCLVSRITLFSIRLQISSAREHCQTIAFASGSFVLRSHAADVSRWLLMPRQAISSLQCQPLSPHLARPEAYFDKSHRDRGKPSLFHLRSAHAQYHADRSIALLHQTEYLWFPVYSDRLPIHTFFLPCYSLFIQQKAPVLLTLQYLRHPCHSRQIPLGSYR